MRRLSLILCIFLAACQVWLPPTLTQPLPSLPPSTSTGLPVATLAPTATLGPQQGSPSPGTATPTLPALDETSFSVRLHPDGSLYVGDQVSFEVIAPADLKLEGRSARVSFQGSQLAEARFGSYGIGARPEAVLTWAWDTSKLIAGAYTLTFSVTPDGPSWSQTLRLLPRGQLPPPEPQASWAAAHSQCCTVYYVTGTAAERDLSSLLPVIDEQAKNASQELGVALSGDPEHNPPIQIVLLPRVLGHGGFASRDIAVSYLDRNYMGGDIATILHHEIVHILDGRLGGDLRPILFVEGLAVYLSGGHYKAEPLMPRAAALLPPEAGCQPWSPSGVNEPADEPSSARVEGCGLGLYVPLARLFDNFYFEQHEVGYLEAAALIQYMVQTWGWNDFSAFYRDIHLQKPASEHEQDGFGDQSRAVDAALYAHFSLTLSQLEERFLQALRQERLTPQNAEDLRQTVRFYDLARRYQQELDPSAYFMNAWVPDSEEMRKRGITADVLRSPSAPENLALETLLVAANGDLAENDYAGTGRLLAAVDTVLGAYPEKGLEAFSLDPLAADYLALVGAAQTAGCQPQRIQLNDSTARVWVLGCSTAPGTPSAGPQLAQLDFVRQPDGWTLRLGSGLLNFHFVAVIGDHVESAACL
jgi:hypothetical protein